jgi:hypothetical protein
MALQIKIRPVIVADLIDAKTGEVLIQGGQEEMVRRVKRDIEAAGFEKKEDA